MSLIKLKNNALDNLTSFTGSASLGDMVFISSATASSSASIEFDLGSYKEYKFFFVNMHPQNNNVNLTLNFSTDSGSNYNVTKTTTFFRAYHLEDNSDAGLGYVASCDLAQSTGEQFITETLGLSNENDSSLSGELSIFNPSSTTYVKHFISNINHTKIGDSMVSINAYMAGYANTTSALTNIRFKMGSGNIDDGKILMFGLN